MLPDNFDFAMLPSGSSNYRLKEIGMLSSTIEDLDFTAKFKLNINRKD